MTLHKSTWVGPSALRSHAWDDPGLDFHALAAKHDGEWFAEAGTTSAVFPDYLSVVDWVMDKYRLAKAGVDSWDSHAATLAGNDGKDWEYLSEDEQRGYLDSARMNARMEG